MTKVRRSTGRSAFYRKNEAETGFFTKISDEAAPRLEKPGFFALKCTTQAETGFFTKISLEAPPTVAKPGFFALNGRSGLYPYNLAVSRCADETARKSGCHHTVRQTAKASQKVHGH